MYKDVIEKVFILTSVCTIMNRKEIDRLNSQLKTRQIAVKKLHPASRVSTFFLFLASVCLVFNLLLFIFMLSGSAYAFGLWLLSLGLAFIFAVIGWVCIIADPTPRLYNYTPSYEPPRRSSAPVNTCSPKHVCPDCGGTGRCKYCRGSGLFNYYYRQSPNTTSACTFCVGTGVCTRCTGRGVLN